MNYMVVTGSDLAYEEFHELDFECSTEEYVSEVEFQAYSKENMRLIRVEGKLAAMLYMQVRGDSLHISRVCVSAAFRRKGLARQLMASARQYAEKRRIHRITLAVASLNDPAVSLYESLGFGAYGRQYRFFVPMYYISDSPSCEVRVGKKINDYIFHVEFYKDGQQIGSGILNTEMGGCRDLEIEVPKQQMEEVLGGLKPFLKTGAGGLYVMTDNWLVVNECLTQGYDADNVIVNMELILI